MCLLREQQKMIKTDGKKKRKDLLCVSGTGTCCLRGMECK